MSLSSQVSLLATRIGTEIKSVRNNFVPNTLRGPIGGVTESTGVQGTVNLAPALSNHRRLIATGNITIAPMAAGVEGQRMLLEINASSGQRSITFDSTYETSQYVPGRTFVIESGQWGYIALIARGSAWRLVSAEPQSIASVASVPSIWTPSDHGLLAWSFDPIGTSTSIGTASGQFVVGAIKVDVSDVSTGISFLINTAGAGFTANRNYMGLYDSTGALVAQVGDLAQYIGTGGIKTVPWLSSVAVTPQTYYVGYITTATTTVPAFAATNGTLLTRGRTAATWRAGLAVGPYTALPTTKVNPTNLVNTPWFGLV